MAIASKITQPNKINDDVAVKIASKYLYLMDNNTRQCYKRKDGWVVFAVKNTNLLDLYVEVK